MEYFENALLPGKKMFRCDRLSASLQVVACAGMWQEANAAGHAPERLFRCKQCPVGAVHAGVADANMSPLKGTDICARCNRTDQRLIGGNICVSCYNRQREVVIGVNAKGKPPAHAKRLDRRCIRYLEGPILKSKNVELSVCMDELVIALLRDSTKRVTLGYSSPTNFRQMRLFHEA